MELELLIGVCAVFLVLFSSLGHPSTIVIPKETKEITLDEAIRNIASVKVPDYIMKMQPVKKDEKSEKKSYTKNEEYDSDLDDLYYTPVDETVAVAVSENTTPPVAVVPKEAWEVEFDEIMSENTASKNNVIPFRTREELLAASIEDEREDD